MYVFLCVILRTQNIHMGIQLHKYSCQRVRFLPGDASMIKTPLYGYRINSCIDPLVVGWELRSGGRGRLFEYIILLYDILWAVAAASRLQSRLCKPLRCIYHFISSLL